MKQAISATVTDVDTLPAMLIWEYSDRFHQHYLLLRGEQVAMVSACVSGHPWLVIVNRQVSSIERPLTTGKSETLAHGKKMAERWARANLPRLEREVAEKKANRPRHLGAGRVGKT